MPTYEASFEFGEFFKLLFKKKVCPKCGQKLRRNIEKTHVGKGWKNMGRTGSGEVSGVYGDHYDATIQYYCQNCEVGYNLKDL